MASLAERLRQKLFGVPSVSSVTTSSAIRNSRKSGFVSSDPFESTEQNKYAYGTLRYPDNLGEFEFGHYMLFHIFEVSQSKYRGPQSETTIENLGFYEAAVKKDYSKQEHNLYSDSVAYEQSGPEELRDTTQDAGGSVSRALRTSDRLVRSTDTIALYLPPGLKQSTTVNYNNSETGLAGVLGADLIGASNVDDLLARLGTQGTFNTLRDALVDTLGVKFATTIADFATGGDLEGVVRKGAQRALNPALEAIFQSVSLREFSFSFRFTPRTPKEQETVNSIVKLFKFHMLPERVQGQSIGRHLLFPSEFEIQYMFQGKENKFYPFVKPCVLTNMSVDYGPGGETQHFRPDENGNPGPIETNMTLSFTETEILTKESVVEGY